MIFHVKILFGHIDNICFKSCTLPNSAQLTPHSDSTKLFSQRLYLPRERMCSLAEKVAAAASQAVLQGGLHLFLFLYFKSSKQPLNRASIFSEMAQVSPTKHSLSRCNYDLYVNDPFLWRKVKNNPSNLNSGLYTIVFYSNAVSKSSITAVNIGCQKPFHNF